MKNISVSLLVLISIFGFVSANNIQIEDSYWNVVPENCKSWYDGCNNCSISDDWLLACTEMYCMENREAKCNEYIDSDKLKDSYWNVISEDCKSWYDGCNTCMVSSAGLACTRMFCETPSESKCNEYISNVIKDNTPTICTMEYDPVCGKKRWECSDTWCFNFNKTYWNSCIMESDGAIFLYEWECEEDKNKIKDHLDDYLEDNEDKYIDVSGKKEMLENIKDKIENSYTAVSNSVKNTFRKIISVINSYL